MLSVFLDADRVNQWHECLTFRRALLENLAEEAPHADLIVVCSRDKRVIDRFRPEDYLPGDDTQPMQRGALPAESNGALPPVLDPALADRHELGTDRALARPSALPSLSTRASQLVRSVFGLVPQ